jgi:hypothetical protein
MEATPEQVTARLLEFLRSALDERRAAESRW